MRAQWMAYCNDLSSANDELCRLIGIIFQKKIKIRKSQPCPKRHNFRHLLNHFVERSRYAAEKTKLEKNQK